MAETLGSCSSWSRLRSVDPNSGAEFPKKTAARSTRRVSASPGVNSAFLASDCATDSTLHAGTIFQPQQGQPLWRSGLVVLRRQLGSLFSDDWVNLRRA